MFFFALQIVCHPQNAAIVCPIDVDYASGSWFAPDATIYMKININGIAICDAIDKNVETSQAFLKWHDALEFAQVHRLQSL